MHRIVSEFALRFQHFIDTAENCEKVIEGLENLYYGVAFYLFWTNNLLKLQKKNCIEIYCIHATTSQLALRILNIVQDILTTPIRCRCACMDKLLVIWRLAYV